MSDYIHSVEAGVAQQPFDGAPDLARMCDIAAEPILKFQGMHTIFRPPGRHESALQPAQARGAVTPPGNEEKRNALDHRLQSAVVCERGDVDDDDLEEGYQRFQEDECSQPGLRGL